MDNRSALNVYPAMIVGRIRIKESMVRTNGVKVLVFDSTNTAACEEIDLKVMIEPSKFEVLLLS